MPAPDNTIADQGVHEFTYSLYAHVEGWQSGGTMRQAYELNYPLIASITQWHAGAWPARQSLARIDEGNVILTVMKKAEDSDGVIFRFYEFEGKATAVRLHLPREAVSAVETDLMEKPGKALALGASGLEVTVPTGPYEIKTIAVKF
jgi:alpha-mannosidase